MSLVGCSGGRARTAWDPQSAARYLDQREQWWMHWPGAERDHDTFCISCHTSLPYALARPRLDAILGGAPSGAEVALTRDVHERVRLWKVTRPYYTDRRDGPRKSLQSRGTEAVLNALILASDDARTGALGADTRSAFDDMWALQETRGSSAGAWPWLDFNLEPWEVADAQYFGAALAAVAVGIAPDDYRSTPAIQACVQRLRSYLLGHYAAQPLHQKLAMLWASTALPGLLDPAERASVIAAVFRAQHRDGGWSLYALSPSYRRGRSLLRYWSDGYATGYVAFVLQRAGVAPTDPRLARGLAWLRDHQRLARGRWVTASINAWHPSLNPESLFMSDAATAYAVLALTQPAGAPGAKVALALRPAR
jgi:squalene-hopene/tetraprenyl-beta-curcumene cyclase